MTRFENDEGGQALLVVLALVGLVGAVAYGYMAFASTTNQLATLRAATLGDDRASDAGATYALWYATAKGFPPAGAFVAPDPGDGHGPPAVTIVDLRPGLGFVALDNRNHGPETYDSPAHTVIGSGEVYLVITWSTDRVGAGRLKFRFDTSPTQPPNFPAQATVTMPAGQSTTTSAVTLPTSGPGTYYLHVANTTTGPETHLTTVDANAGGPGDFAVEYPGMVFQALSVRNGQTTAVDAGLTLTAGVYTATVNSWTLR